jgi:hypothetical protein
VWEEPAAGAGAEGTGPGQGEVGGDGEFGGVVEEDDDRAAAHGLDGLGSVRGRDPVPGGGRRLAQAVERPERSPGEHLGERVLGVGRDLGRGRDPSPRPASVPEFDSGGCF